VFRRIRLTSDPGVEVQAAARSAVAAIGRHTDQTHAKALALIDELCTMVADASESPVDVTPSRQVEVTRL
jgi:hypothetical protein